MLKILGRLILLGAAALGAAALVHRQDVGERAASFLANRRLLHGGAYEAGLSKEARAFLAEAAEDAKSASRVELIEGVPRPPDPREPTRPWKVRHLSGFYEPPLVPPKLAWDRAAELGLGPDGFKTWAGEKMCGGFHPDWAVGWETPAGRLELLVCFGCEEVKIFSPRGHLRLDLDKTKSELLDGFFRAQKDLAQTAPKQP